MKTHIQWLFVFVGGCLTVYLIMAFRMDAMRSEYELALSDLRTTASFKDLHRDMTAAYRNRWAGVGNVVQSIKIVRASFYYDVDERRTRPKKMIEFEISNATKAAISGARIRARLVTPGRSIPWVDSEFYAKISGGLEPGESKQLTFNVDDRSEWRDAPVDPNGLVLTIELLSADTPSGMTL